MEQIMMNLQAEDGVAEHIQPDTIALQKLLEMINPSDVNWEDPDVLEILKQLQYGPQLPKDGHFGEYDVFGPTIPEDYIPAQIPPEDWACSGPPQERNDGSAPPSTNPIQQPDIPKPDSPDF
jgi:hypothetical protein